MWFWADAPTLSVETAAGDNANQIRLFITTALVDTDGSESLKILIDTDLLPPGATLSRTEISNPGAVEEVLLTLPTTWDTPGTFASAAPEIQHYCQAHNLLEFIAKQRAHHKQERVFNKFLSDWFDGFRTLKFIHFMRDHFLPSVPLSELGEAEFVDATLLPELSLLKQQLSGRLFHQAPASGSEDSRPEHAKIE